METHSINGVHPEQRVNLFLAKLKACEKTYDFSDPRAQFSLKETKRRHLVDIAEYVSANKGVFNERTYIPFMRMVSANVLRALPQGTSADQYYEPEEDEPYLEPSWPHLQIVYELLRKFVVSSDTDSVFARECITLEFVNGIIELFNSEDPREREYLKTILHRIYGKVMPLRSPIRAAVMNVFHRVIYDGERFNGVAELLEILGSIINGFAVPLKEEHRDLLRKGLLPLHIPSSLPLYQGQLSFCVSQFAEKDPSLALEIVKFLLRHWPATHSRKEVMLLNEMEEILELIRPEALSDLAQLLFRRIGRCIESSHFQVAERALFYWNNEHVMKLIVHYRQYVMPAVIGPITRNLESHWNGNVLSLSCNVQRLLCEMDEKLFDKCSEMYQRELRDRQRREAERRMRWGVVYRMAERKVRTRQDASGVDGCEDSAETAVRKPRDLCSGDNKTVLKDSRQTENMRDDGVVARTAPGGTVAKARDAGEGDARTMATKSRLRRQKRAPTSPMEQEASC